jgi:hypothetical protein
MDDFMKTQDLFAINRQAKKLNEGLARTFGKKINLENFNVQQLEDARNKLRTQLSQVRTESGFNENLENDAYHEAKFMLDAIIAEIAERQEIVADTDMSQTEGVMSEIAAELGQVADDEDYDKLYDLLGDSGPVGKYLQKEIDDITGETGLHPKDDFEKIEAMLMDRIQQEFGGNSDDEGGETDDGYALASAGFGSDEDYGDFGRDESIEQTESSDFVKGVKRFIKGKKNPSDVRDAHLAKATFGDPAKKDKEGSRYDKVQNLISKESTQGESMSKIIEGEIQQASAIVTAKTMVDRVGRWIEELSGMENDTLLQLGDSIRDEMGQAQAKAFIEAVAPAIQQALENLKSTRETLSTGMRTLTGEEQPAEMLGGSDDAGGMEAEPDAMNAEPELGDEFAAAEPASGGEAAAGREQRESIQFQNRLMKVLAG